MRGAGAGAGIGLLLACAVLPACSKFGDAGAATNVGDASTQAASACGLAVTDSFPDLNAWGKVGTATFAVDDALGTPAPSVLVKQPGDGDKSYLARQIDIKSCTRVVVSAYVKVDTWGDGELDIFGVHKTGSAPDQTVVLVHSKGTAQSLAAEGPDGTKPIGAGFADLTRVEIALDFPASRWEIRVEGAGTVASGEIPSDWTAGPIEIRVGTDYAVDQTQPWVLHFDELQVHGDP